MYSKLESTRFKTLTKIEQIAIPSQAGVARVRCKIQPREQERVNESNGTSSVLFQTEISSTFCLTVEGKGRKLSHTT